jgi:subtilase family serine protease
MAAFKGTGRIKDLSMRGGISIRRLLVLCAVTVGFSGVGDPSALAAVQNRLTVAISDSNFVDVPDSVHPKVALAVDLGPAAADTRLQGMTLRFSMTADQQAALDQLLANQQNPASPRYHQWLSPAEYAAQFGLSSADMAKVSAWLTGEGFTVTSVANGGMFIAFDGTVAQAQRAFSTSIHNLSLNGTAHFANVRNASVPSALASVVGAVTGLHNFRLQPRARTRVVSPEYTSSISQNHYVAPGDIYTIYNSTPLLNNSINGAGETIAVLGQVDIYAADVVAFRSASGLSTTNLPTTVHAFGTDPGNALTCNPCTTGPTQGDLAESSIDVEWSGAMAPSATILFVNGTNVLPGATGTDAMSFAIDNNLAPIITNSYGNCESAWGSTDILAANNLFKQASAQGQTILAASGDQGATDCDAGPVAGEGRQVDFPGSSPYVTSMGGTQFNDGTATGATQYWSSTNGATGGSALSYIPEAVWSNEAAVGNYNFGGGGGGASAFFTKPTWQVGSPADAARDVPDLALAASDAHDAFLYCVNVALSESCTTGYRTASNSLNVAGGTSFDSQIFGGMLALIEQEISATKGLGNINPTLYALGNNPTYAPLVFNDVTAGNNSMPCYAGPQCGNGGITGLTGGLTGFNAGVGYDLASGWGSVNVNGLATDWNKVTPLGSGSLGSIPTGFAAVVSAPFGAVVSGTTVTLTGVVGPLTTSPIIPTGTIQFMANGVLLGSTGPIAPAGGGTTSAEANYSWATGCSNVGQNVISASYSGDVNYQGSRGPSLDMGEVGRSGGTGFTSNGSVVVVNQTIVFVTSTTCPDFSLVPSGAGLTVSGSSGNVSVAAGGTIPAITISAAGVNGFTGTVTFSATLTSTSGYAPTLSFSPASVTIASSAQSTMLTLTGITAELQMPTAPAKVDSGRVLAWHNARRAPWYADSGVMIASLLLLALPRRRRLSGLLMVALAIALVGGVTGCGGSSSQSGSSTTTTVPPVNPYIGTYVVTVIGTYTSPSGQSTQHVAAVTYVVK